MNNRQYKISVIGLGYIGLPTATILAKSGFNVLGIDINEDVIASLKKGEIHIVEPNLDELVKEVVKKGSLSLSTNLEHSDVFIIAVPTPLTDTLEPDLQYVESVAENLAEIIEPGNLVVVESTVPIGTTEKLRDTLQRIRSDLNFSDNNSDEDQVYIAHCPERVLPGNVLFELIHNDRIVGGIDTASSNLAFNFYKEFVKGQIYLTDSKTAELSKLVENSFRDVNIAFANELSLISEEFGINVWELINLANKHPRVDILQPGPGVGGHCIAIDPLFIVNSSPENSQLIKKAREVNNKKPLQVLKKIKNVATSLGDFSEVSVATLGLSFKKNIDDLRESPALEIAEEIDKLGFKNHFIIEPNIELLPIQFDETTAELCDLERGISLADIILILVDHDEFSELKSKDLSTKKIIDTRGMLQTF